MCQILYQTKTIIYCGDATMAQYGVLMCFAGFCKLIILYYTYAPAT